MDLQKMHQIAHTWQFPRLAEGHEGNSQCQSEGCPKYQSTGFKTCSLEKENGGYGDMCLHGRKTDVGRSGKENSRRIPPAMTSTFWSLYCCTKRSMVYWKAVGFSRMVVTSQNRMPFFGKSAWGGREMVEMVKTVQAPTLEAALRAHLHGHNNKPGTPRIEALMASLFSASETIL
eukprot:406395-Pelagomonas_calceolata.AAC.1